jgi:hypothetical protein
MATVNLGRIRLTAVAVAKLYRDEGTEVNLTAIEEDIQILFHLTDAQFEVHDISWVIWEAIDAAGMI